MRLPTLVAGVVAGLAGLVGAAAGYQQLTASPQRSETVEVAQSSPQSAPAADVSPSTVTRVRLKDCPRGFKLKGRTCERVVERTVVIDVAPPAAAPARAVAPAPAPVRTAASRGGDDDPATHDAGDDHGGRGDEAGDDHGDRGEDHGDEADEDHGDDHGDEADEVEDEDHHGEDGEDGHHGDEPDEPEDD